MVRSDNPKPTKELILDAAFSFLEQPRLTSFSMNELASKVGISKPAIYRHFASKDALLDAMENHIVDNMSVFLKEISSSDRLIAKKSLANLIGYFIKNPTYINYFIAQMSSTPNYEEHLYKKLYEREVSFEKNENKTAYLETFRNDMCRFSQHVYCGMTIFYFVKVQERLRKCGKIHETPVDFSDKIVNLMMEGLAGTTEKNDAFHPEKISDERKKELIDLCRIDEKVFPEENRIFKALAAVIEKYKMPGVTVERIATELGMAKSSLYEYFENKNQMIKTLVNKELQLLQTIVIENSIEARNFTEYVYVLMVSEMEYFTHRSSIIPICGWLLMGGEDFSKSRIEDCEVEGEAAPWEKRLPDRGISPDLGFPYQADVITGWIKCLPVSFLVEAKGKNLSNEKRMEGFMHTIDYILNGIK